MTKWLSTEEQQAWRGLLESHARLLARLNQSLQEASGLSLSDYDVLVALTDIDEPSMRMGRLGEVLHWEKSRLSRQISRMSDRGLVTRRQSPEDRRGAYVQLTHEGRTAIDAAAPTHVALVRRLVFDALRPRQVAELTRINRALQRALDEDEPTSDEQ